MSHSQESSHEKSEGRKHGEKPLSSEDTLKLQNEPDKDLPEAIHGELSASRIYVHGVGHRRDIDDYMNAVEGLEGTWSMRLPSGASVGLPGRTGERLHRASVAIDKDTSTTPHRPEWS